MDLNKRAFWTEILIAVNALDLVDLFLLHLSFIKANSLHVYLFIRLRR